MLAIYFDNEYKIIKYVVTINYTVTNTLKTQPKKISKIVLKIPKKKKNRTIKKVTEGSIFLVVSQFRVKRKYRIYKYHIFFRVKGL